MVRGLKWVVLGWAMAAVAVAASPSGYLLKEGEVRFVCEGPDVTVPAWGQFTTVEGALTLDPNDLSKAKGNLDVYMVSIRTDDAAWDTMFRRAGFLEIDEHPKARFVVDTVRGPKRLERGRWTPMTLEGHFVLHGITKKISVPATARWMGPNPEKETGERIRVRTSFHVTWEDYEIAMPTGSTRAFAGDGALIHADLTYELAEGKRKKRK